MQVWNVLQVARWKYRMQKIAICAPSHNLVGLYLCNWGTYRQSEKQQYLPHMSLQYDEHRPTNGWDLLASLGHPSKFQRLSHLGSVTARHSSSGRQPNCEVLNRGRHLYSAGRPWRWALAHILVDVRKLVKTVCLPCHHESIGSSRKNVVVGDFVWLVAVLTVSQKWCNPGTPSVFSWSVLWPTKNIIQQNLFNYLFNCYLYFGFRDFDFWNFLTSHVGIVSTYHLLTRHQLFFMHYTDKHAISTSRWQMWLYCTLAYWNAGMISMQKNAVLRTELVTFQWPDLDLDLQPLNVFFTIWWQWTALWLISGAPCSSSCDSKIFSYTWRAIWQQLLDVMDVLCS